MADDYEAIINALKREIEIANERIRQLRHFEALVLTDTDHATGKTRRRTVLQWGADGEPTCTLGPWGPWE